MDTEKRQQRETPPLTTTVVILLGSNNVQQTNKSISLQGRNPTQRLTHTSNSNYLNRISASQTRVLMMITEVITVD